MLFGIFGCIVLYTILDEFIRFHLLNLGGQFGTCSLLFGSNLIQIMFTLINNSRKRIGNKNENKFWHNTVTSIILYEMRIYRNALLFTVSKLQAVDIKTIAI